MAKALSRWPAPLRSIVREHLFEDSLASLIPAAEAADDFVMAAERVLSQDPELGKPIAPGSPIYVIPMAPVRDRAVALYYSFDAETVTFVAIAAFD